MTGYPTTRRHPRSMAEAFPKDHAAAIHHYRNSVPRVDKALGVLLAIVIGVFGALALVHALLS